MKAQNPTSAALKLITYVRVSTAKQGQSGLGLDAQETAIRHYVALSGGTVIKTYKEIESGRKNDRPQLAAALAHAKRARARLVIAKLDRLARNVHFISGLNEAKVDFVACDNPHATRLTLNILASIAEHEAEMISTRTMAALQAAKARGQLLGSARPGHWNGREDVRRAAVAKAQRTAKEKRDAEASPIYTVVKPIIQKMKADGHSLSEIADELNDRGFTTLRGAAWNKMQVSRLVA